MRTIIDQLPKAIRWSNILMWLFGITAVVLFIGSVLLLFNEPVVGVLVLLATLFIGVQFWLMRNYKNACQEAFDSEHSADIELACKAQSTLVKFYGILILIFIILLILGVVFGLSAYQSYISRY